MQTMRKRGGGQMVIAGGVTRPDPVAAAARSRLLSRAAADRCACWRAATTACSRAWCACSSARRDGARRRTRWRPNCWCPKARSAASRSRSRRSPMRARPCRAHALGAARCRPGRGDCDGRVLAIEGAEGTDAMLRRVAARARQRGGAAARHARQGPEARPGIARRHAGHRPAHDRRRADGGPRRRRRRGRRACCCSSATEAIAQGRCGAACSSARSGRRRCALWPQELPARAPAGIAPHRPARAERARSRSTSSAGLAGRRRGWRRSAPASGAVVSRAYVLGARGGGGRRAPCSRASAALRQWGLSKRRRAGVLVRRLDASDDRAGMPTSVLREAAAQALPASP